MSASPLAEQLEALRPTLLRFARLQLRQAQDAEDAVQDTLLAALEGQAGFSGKAQLKTWVIAILRNKLIDRIRKYGREMPLDDADDAESFDVLFDASGHWIDPPRAWGNPEATLSQAQFYDVLEVCVTALPEKQARAFTMHTVLGFEADEICKVLGLSASNYWVLLYRARMRLRECLELKWFGQQTKGRVCA